MAKWNKTVVGSVIKSKDKSKPDYVKFKTNVSFKEGDTLSLETKAFKLSSLQEGVQAGRLNEELAAKIRETIEKMPDFVRGDLVRLTKNE